MKLVTVVVFAAVVVVFVVVFVNVVVMKDADNLVVMNFGFSLN